MTSRERVLTALSRRQPDRVPYCELGVDRSLAQRLMGWGAPASQASNLEANAYTVEEAKALAAFLKLDNLSYVLRAPVYAHKEAGQDGRLFYGDGLIRTEADLDRLQLPDPTDDALYAGAAAFLEQKGEYSAWFVTRIGIFPTMLSLGTENFCLALYDNRRFVEAVLDRYVDWIVVVAERVCRMGFDVFASTDDMAFNTDPFFSPAVFRELIKPRLVTLFAGLRRLAPGARRFFHSDGNVRPLLPDFIDMGVDILNPVHVRAAGMEPSALKRDFGRDLVFWGGGVDTQGVLPNGAPQAVKDDVRRNVEALAPGGGFVFNTVHNIQADVPPANIVAMWEALRDT